MDKDMGVAASPPGHSDEPASGLAAIAGSVPNAFEREDRYIAIKRNHLSAMQETSLRAHMAQLGIAPVHSVVVESDWPEYDAVWKMIEDRVTETPAQAEAQLLADIAAMMGEFVDNWPQPKRVSTALKLIAKTIRTLLDPEPVTCPRAISPLRYCTDCPDDERCELPGRAK